MHAEYKCTERCTWSAATDSTALLFCSHATWVHPVIASQVFLADIKCGVYIHGPCNMIDYHFASSMIFHLASPTGHTSNLSKTDYQQH